jgi:hypothetical protein
LPEIEKCLASLGNKRLDCYLLFFLPLPYTFNIVSNFWLKETNDEDCVVFLSEISFFASIGNFSFQIGEKSICFAIDNMTE